MKLDEDSAEEEGPGWNQEAIFARWNQQRRKGQGTGWNQVFINAGWNQQRRKVQGTRWNQGDLCWPEPGNLLSQMEPVEEEKQLIKKY